MGMKYVKDFKFSKDAGFSGSCAPMKKAAGGMAARRDAMLARRAESDARRTQMREEMDARRGKPAGANVAAGRAARDAARQARYAQQDRRYGIGAAAPEKMRDGGEVQRQLREMMREERKKVPIREMAEEMQRMMPPPMPPGRDPRAMKKGGVMKKSEGGAASKGPKTRETPAKSRRKAKERRTDLLAREKLEYAAKHVPGMDLDNIHDAELREEAEKVEKFSKGGNAKKAVHKHEKAMHPGKPLTKLKRGGLPVHKGNPMYGKK